MAFLVGLVARAAVSIGVRVVMAGARGALGAAKFAGRHAGGHLGSAGRSPGRFKIRVLEDRFGHAKKEIEAAMVAALDTAANTAVRSAKRRAPVRTGALRDSITRTGVEGTGSRATVVVFTDRDYAKFVEFGGALKESRPYIRPGAKSGIRKYRSEVRAEIKRRLPGA